MPIPVFVLFGQTATGKTDLLSNLFSSCSHRSLLAGCAEVVNADSVQVYKDACVCSCLPDENLTKILPHHLVAIKNCTEEFSASDFVSEAEKIIPFIYNRRLLPVIAGGTGFFITNFVYGLPSTPAANPATRVYLQEKLKNEGITPLFEELKKIDRVTASRLNIADEYRILRALEVYYDSGQPLSEYKIKRKMREEYNFLIVSLERRRDDIYRRIEMRLEKMASYLRDEFISIYEKCKKEYSDPASLPIFKSIGYKEFFCINHENPHLAPLEKVLALINKNTKKYAKRQETYAKQLHNKITISMEEKNWYETLHNLLVSFYVEHIKR